jgi:hypothetical protein
MDVQMPIFAVHNKQRDNSERPFCETVVKKWDEKLKAKLGAIGGLKFSNK